jgi:hypothetical protein
VLVDESTRRIVVDTSGTASIGTDALAHATRVARIGLIAGIGFTTLLLLCVGAGFAGLPAAAAAIAATTCLTLAAFGWATFVHQRTVVAIGSTSAWRLEPVESGEVGRAEMRRVRLKIGSSFWVHEPWDAASSSRHLLGQPHLEVAGDLQGKVLLRVPGDPRVRIFKPRY